MTKDAKVIDTSINCRAVKEWFDSHVKSKSQVEGAKSFVANGPYQEYKLGLRFIIHLADQDYEMAMLCIDAFTKYSVIVPIKSNSESELALGFIKSMIKLSVKEICRRRQLEVAPKQNIGNFVFAFVLFEKNV